MKFKSLALSLMVYSIATTTSFATTDLPFNQQLKDLINENFQSNDGVMSEDKILKYQENIELRKAQVENAMYNYLTKYEGEKDKNALEDIKEEGLIKIYEMILAHIEELRNAKSSYEANMIAQKILELDYSSKVEGVETKLSAQLDYVKANLKKWSIHKTNAPDGEASNLIDPKTGEFYTQHELDEMKKRGEDLSLLNPPAENSFWTQYDIENSNLEEVYRGGKHRMYEGVDLSFPDHRDCDFHKVRKTQSKPKLDVKCDINGEQIKFKLKLGSEMHSEITTASLISLLGFHHDPSKYYQNFKMTLKKGMSYKEFVQDYESYFEGEKYPLSEYIKEKGKDSREEHMSFFMKS